MFYLIVIPATIGAMGIFVISDAGRSIIGLGKGNSRSEDNDETETTPQADKSGEDA
jgi:hypothetical protein